MAITICTNHAAITSARRWIGALVRCAAWTMWMMRASSVSEPTLSARISSEPLPLMVAPVTLSPACFDTGTGSPVIMDSSTWLAPSSTLPSTGTFSPGLTRSRSPTWTEASGTCSSLPSWFTRHARLGASFSSSRIAWLVWPMARVCSTSPSNTSVTITAAASKYVPTEPVCSRNASGNKPGANSAARLNR